MKQIIGHRGAGGLALENSETAFRKALSLGVNAIELDVRLTKDKKLVVNHDPRLARVSQHRHKISQHSWDELAKFKLKDNSPLLRLEDALKIIGLTPVIIELKDPGSRSSLFAVLDRFPKARATIGSFQHQEIIDIKQHRPQLPCYIFTVTRPVHIIRLAAKHGLDGVSMPWWVLNRYIYRQLEQNQLAAYVYGVRSVRSGQRLTEKFPKVAICTDYPDRFIVKTTEKS